MLFHSYKWWFSSLFWEGFPYFSSAFCWKFPWNLPKTFWERYSRGNYIMGIEGAWGRAHPLNATEISWGNKALYFWIIKGSWWLIIFDNPLKRLYFLGRNVALGWKSTVLPPEIGSTPSPRISDGSLQQKELSGVWLCQNRVGFWSQL